MDKAHENINWENRPSQNTPINERNLNKMDNSIDEIDNRVLTLYDVKLDKAEAQTLVKSITYNRANGVFTITYLNNTAATIDTTLEKLAVNFTYDRNSQQLIITLDDGTKQYVDLSALITQYEFLDSDTINFIIDESGRVSAKVKEGSIQEKHLRPDYLADIKIEASKAQSAASEAEASETNAANSAEAAALSATLAAEHALAAYESKETAKKSEANARESENNAKGYADTAALSATLAAEHASAAYDSRNAAEKSETNAASSKTAAANSASTAAQKATDASNYADKAKSYAVGGTGTRPGEDTDNAKYYYEQLKDSLGGSGLSLKGKIPFSQIPTAGNSLGDMYDISEKFITDSRFLEGAGYSYPAGTNIYWTEDGKWDCLAGAEKMELTQAQYNALSTAEKNNGTVYYITDADDALPPASEEQAGLMQPEDKAKLDGIEEGATRVVVDSSLSASSENPVQNKAVKAAIDAKANIASPTFTGTPKVPTAASGTNSTQIATTAFVNTAVANHNSSATAHSDIRSLITSLTTRLNALADSDDTTLDQLSEIVAYIKANRGLIESVTTSKVNVSDIVDNLTSTDASKPLSAKQGKVLSDLIAALSASSGNAPSASTTTPKVAGTASVGTENAYARGDHVHPAQTSVSGNAGTATKLATARVINGMSFDGTANRMNRAPCWTPSGTAAKTVDCEGFSLIAGAEIAVKFAYTNTASNPTLNVNSTGAKPIYYGGSAIPPGYFEPYVPYIFRYSGTEWDLVGCLSEPVLFDYTGIARRYTGFGKLKNSAIVGTSYSQFCALVSGVGNLGNNFFGTYLVTCSTRGSTKMTVTQLETSPNEQYIKFGYWNDGDDVIFGIYSDAYNYPMYVTPLTRKTLPSFLYNSTVQPEGWTPVGVKKFVTGIKGNSEEEYRSGNVNLTADNIGALPLSGGIMSGNINMKDLGIEYNGESTHLSGAKGNAAIVSTGTAGQHTVLFRGLSTNGRFMDVIYNQKRSIEYMSEERVKEGVNSPNYSLELLNEEGNSTFPGTVSASLFDGNSTSATKLQTPRNINSVPFDGTGDIQLQEYYNFRFPKTLREKKYRGFCSLYNASTVSANPSMVTLLISGAGSYDTGGAGRMSGTYLVSCSTMGGTVMRVTELEPPLHPGEMKFGYWPDGNKIVFGMYQDVWGYEVNVLKIFEGYGNIYKPIVANLYDDTTEPSGWTEVADIIRYAKSDGISGVKQLTQAQYDALSAAEKTNNTVYFITDAD